MQAELNSDTALTAANELVSHLRRTPEAALLPARDLANRFGLDEAFVAQVLQGIHAQRRSEARPVAAKPSSLRTLGFALQSFWFRLTNRPFLFIIVSFVITFIAVIVCSMIPSRSDSGLSTESIITTFVLLGILGLNFMLHMAVYFRHRSARYPVYGGLFLFGSSLTWLTYSFAAHGAPKSQGVPDPMVLYMVVAMGLLTVSLAYVGFGALAAVLGGWTRIKLQARAEETMSRQDLLERYFELQTRLQQSAYPRSSGQGPAIFSSPLIAWYRDRQYVPNLAVGMLVSTLALVCMAVGGLNPAASRFNGPLNFWILILMLIGVAGIIFHVLQGYVSKSAWQALLGALCISGGSVIIKSLPLGELTAASREDLGWGPYIATEAINAVVMAAISCASYLGAVYQTQAVREANLQRNDQATLLAEMVRIQWKLSNETSAICVMVVDAAKSSEMKADADPLAVEYTFREYQEWIESISVQRNGRLHSTAGDGAIVAFDSTASALASARRIQSDIFRFNKDVNRLALPFRLRIGLHTGEVVGDIHEVQFTEVIDIAAHIEAACPVGGIAVTDEVVGQLPEEQFISLEKEIDGHKVFMVTNPTEYA